MNSKLIVLLFLICSKFVFGNLPQIAQLKTDYQINPLGLDNPKPEFSWIVQSDVRGMEQSAFEILVADDLKKLDSGNCWKSERISGNQTFGVEYRGKPLKSFTRYFWKIKIWDQNGNESGWSKPAWFETSMMNPADWKAKWISDQRPLPEKDEDFYKETPNPLLRKEIILKKELKSARLYIAGLGYSISYINGQRVGDHMLDMPWTQFGRQVMYNTFDVTPMLHKGKNAIGVMLGNGWYNPMPIRMFQRWNLRDYLTVGKPCVKAQIRIVYTDGSVETLGTDSGWKAGEGPVLKNSVYLGELYDARQEQKGWAEASFSDSHWQKAKVEAGPAGRLVAQYIPPVRATKILKPAKMIEPKPGVYLFDFGQNFAGVPRLKVNGPAGTTVTLRGGEDVHRDGTLNYLTVIAGQLKAMWNLRGGPGCPDDPMMVNTYILKGDGDEVFTPEFTFSSFRYLEVTGFPGKPDLNSVEGLRMNTDLQEAGSFECSNELFNRIQEMVKWTFLSNVFSVQSDCPAREKLGYGGDIVATAESFSYNFDMSSFYRKVVQDFVNDARANGEMTAIAPNMGISENDAPIGWQLAFPVGMKVLYDYYGDIATATKDYDVLKKQVDFFRSVYLNCIPEIGIGDHESLDPKTIALTSTAFYYHHVIILSEFAKLLGNQVDAETYQNLASEIRDAFIKRFLNTGTGVFDTGTEAAQLFALYYNLVPESEKAAAIDHLLMEIYGRHKGHLSTGIFGTKYLFEVFRRENRNDVAYTVANQREFPGYGNMLAHGATTLYESWVYPDTAASQNHPMFGSITEWYYKSILGINATAPGFKKIEIKPQPAGDLAWAKGRYDAMVGRIESDWKIEGPRFYLRVSIPANTKARISVPSLPGRPVLESGQDALKSESMKFIGFSDGYANFETGSGNYSFESTYQK